MDRAYEGDQTRQLVLDWGFASVVPSRKTHLQPWQYNREMYKKRNEIATMQTNDLPSSAVPDAPSNHLTQRRWTIIERIESENKPQND